MANEKVVTAGDENISLVDIISFFRRNWVQISIWGLAGFLIATAYVVLTPKKYEARWKIQMAQLVSGGNSNSEEPATLVQRLRDPGTYAINVRQDCGVS